MNNANDQAIELYSKQLRLPTFNHYGNVIRQLGNNKGYEEFLLALMKMELDSRMDSSQKRKIKTANFPYVKTIDELNCSRFEHITEAFIHELASCDFVSKRQNIVMYWKSWQRTKHILVLLSVSKHACKA